MKVLVLNSGSSSQKACLYEIGERLPENAPVPMWEGRIEWGPQTAALSIRTAEKSVNTDQQKISSRELLLKNLLTTMLHGETRCIESAADIDFVGHRIVHGGQRFQDPVLITEDVCSALARVSDFAPLHIDAELEGIRTVRDLIGDVPQVAVFDTGFHRQMPLAAQVYPGPYDWVTDGIRRYGFHGINHRYCAERAAQLLEKGFKSLRIVSCHLGNGCSVTAIESGSSVDTTMGFTPLEGLMMGTRSGSVDPAILVFLMRRHGLNADEIDETLNRKSGLLGISGLSGDMRDILAAMHAGNDRAKLAFDIYIHRLRTAIGGMAAVLGGMDVLVFTGGVGENSPEVRAATCSQLGFLGLTIDPKQNERPKLDAGISGPESRVQVLVIRAQEDWAIAGECWKLSRKSVAVT